MITNPKEAIAAMVGQKLEGVEIKDGVATLIFERDNTIVFDGDDLNMHIFVEQVN